MKFWPKKEGTNTTGMSRPVLYILLFLGVLAYFTWLNASPGFSDPDSFYHARISQMIMENGIIHDFPWLPLTTLNDVYIDHHLLYHLALIPFIWLFGDPMVGTKVAAILFGALAIVVFQWLLDKQKIKYSWAYTAILLLTDQFVFRMNLAKTSSLSLLILMVWFYFLLQREKKLLPLFLLGFSYVWLYGGWIIMFGLAIIYLGINLIFSWLGKRLPEKIRTTKYKLKTTIYKSVAIIAGIAGGLIINPYFPKNLVFYWQQTIKIGLVNYKKVVQVGNEWYGFSPVDFIGQDVFIFVLLIIALVLFVIRIKKQGTTNWFFLFTVIIFGALTIKSQRNIEYFSPLALLFVGLIVSELLKSNERDKYISWVEKNYQNNKTLSFTLVLLAGLSLMATATTSVWGLHSGLRGGSQINRLQGVSNWLEENSEIQETVFHDNWSDWPIFFYHNQKNSFIAGLDPSFLYFKDPEKYKLWVKIATGDTENYEGAPCEVINKEFNSRYIFLDDNNNEFRLSLARDNNCELVYKDEEGFIYAVVNEQNKE